MDKSVNKMGKLTDSLSKIQLGDCREGSAETRKKMGLGQESTVCIRNLRAVEKSMSFSKVKSEIVPVLDTPYSPYLDQVHPGEDRS